MVKTITDVGYLSDVALVTINNIPNTPQNLAKILHEMSSRHIPVDMISSTTPYKERFNLSFTVPQENLAEVVNATASFKALDKNISTDLNGNNTKVILSGNDMRNAYGVAAELFGVLADENIPVKLITTAESEISCLVDIRDIEKVKKIFKQ